MISAKIAEASGGLPSITLIAATTGTKKHKIYKIIMTSNATANLAISDGFGTYYAIAGVPIVLDYGQFGKFQSTADTLISITPSADASVGALVEYEDY